MDAQSYAKFLGTGIDEKIYEEAKRRSEYSDELKATPWELRAPVARFNLEN